MTRLDEYKQMLVEFHTAFKLPIARSFAEADSKNCPLRINLLAEEFQEYRNAKERVEIIDALGDLCYVTIGATLTVGVTPLDLPKALEVIPNKGVLPKLDITMSVVALIRKLEQPVLCYRGLLDTLTKLYFNLEQASWALGFDLLTAVRLIHASNMSKLWTKEEIRSIQDTPDLFSITSSLEGKYIVKRTSDGKVIKSPGYSPVELSAL